MLKTDAALFDRTGQMGHFRPKINDVELSSNFAKYIFLKLYHLGGRVIPHPLYWFFFNNSETLKAVILTICSI